ncbi:MAG: acetylxylan esterase [Myxococcota bacterium]
MNLLVTLLLGGLTLWAGSPSMDLLGPVYDEDLVPDYTLPDPLTMSDGEPVRDAETWANRRRGEVLRLFREHVYGEAPQRPEGMRFEVIEEDPEALGGRATRKQVTIYFAARGERPKMDLLLYLPNGGPRPAPTFLGLNFDGNHTVEDDPAIHVTTQWVRDATNAHRATEESRGARTSRWPVARILRRGYGLATAYYGDLVPDHDDGFRNGVHPLFYDPDQERPAEGEWGAIAAWAWGLSRAMDYLQRDPDVDHGQVAVMGHSRLGKTALWAGARDPRFALVVSNQSGCGGAALSRRAFGQTVHHINAKNPHWFTARFATYGDAEDDLPVDQHMLLALVAPRPVLINSAVEDRWADPRGEFLSAVHAGPVYELLGAKPLAADSMPETDHLVGGTVGYHVRAGGHDVTPADWEVFLDFADHHLRRRP